MGGTKICEKKGKLVWPKPRNSWIKEPYVPPEKQAGVVENKNRRALRQKNLYPKKDKPQHNATVFSNKNFDRELLETLSWEPEWLQEPYAWVGHLPFARWLVGELKPKLFVELGTHTGNSYFSICQGVAEESLKTRCFAVDTWKGDEQAGFYGDESFQMVQTHNQAKFRDFSTLLRMTFDEALGRFENSSIDLLHIDGLHTNEAVRHDFESWLPKLAPGALVLFHDIKVGHGEFGVWKFWAELKERYPDHLEFRHSHGLGILNIPGGSRRDWLNQEKELGRSVVEVMQAAGEAAIQKAQNKNLEKQISLHQNRATPSQKTAPFKLELFYKNEGQEFSEKHKMQELGTVNEDAFLRIAIAISGSAARAEYWRLDPGDQPGVFDVRQIKFLDTEGHNIWDIGLHQNQISVCGTARRLAEDSLVFINTGSDPQLILPCLNLVEKRIAKIVVEIRPIEVAEAVKLMDSDRAKLAAIRHDLGQRLAQNQSRVVQLEADVKLKQREAEAARLVREEFEAVRGEAAKTAGVLARLAGKVEADAEQSAQGRQAFLAALGGLGLELGQVRKEGDAREAARKAEMNSLQENLRSQVKAMEAAQKAEVEGLKEALVMELRGLAAQQEERLDRERAEGEARLASIQAAIEGRAQEMAEDQKKNEQRLRQLGSYLGKVQEMAFDPWLNFIPAPFSWPILLFIARGIKRPDWFPPSQAVVPKKPGFWRRLEQSIRKKRKAFFARISFNKKWYLENNPDVKAQGIDPWQHYCKFGMAEGRKKNPQDNSKFKLQSPAPKNYGEWIKKYDTLTDADRVKMSLLINSMDHQPVFSIVIPVFNPRPNWLRRAIESVRKQIYPHWQICLVDDNSTDSEVVKIIREESAHDPRITFSVRGKNGGISVASNEALGLAKGDWVTFLDHDDELKEDALFWVAHSIYNRPETVIVYTDEDKIDEMGNRFDPHFKPEWNPELLLSYNYFCHLLAIRKDLIRQVGGFRVAFDGAQDYDLVLRCIAEAGQKNLLHIPRILYHWRAHQNSTAQNMSSKPKAQEAGRKALTEHLNRQGVNGTVSCVDSHYRIKYALKVQPRVSILIPTRDQPAVLRLCVDSLREKTQYLNYEIILIDNGTTDGHATALLRKYESDGLTVLRDNKPFNYSRLNNNGAKFAKGDLLLLLNNDIEIKSGEWLENMVSEIGQRDVGVVGAKLLYPDGRLQHGGVILGVGGIAGHAHKYLPSSLPGYFSRAQVVQEISAVTAACMLIRKELFHKVGGLDEVNLKVAFNDVDLCLKAREEGWRVVWTPFAELIHHESASRGPENTPEKHARFVSEINFMKNKWGNKLLTDLHYNPNLTLESEDFALAFPPRIKQI